MNLFTRVYLAASTKDANQQLTKRKTRLEEDLEKTKKKLQETEKSLRNSELSSKDCKQASGSVCTTQ